MQEGFDFIGYGNQVRKFCQALMCSAGSAVEISGQMHLLAVAAERDLERFGAPAETSRIACGPGCDSCCVLSVAVLFPEAIAIAGYLQHRLSDNDLAELCDKLQEAIRSSRWLDDEEYLFLRQPCVFLDAQGRCMIHIVRPLLCRANTSTSPEACREALAMVPLHGAPMVEMDLFQKELFETVYRGIGDALEYLGLDHRPRRLSMAVLMLLTKPEAALIFAAGEKLPFH